MPRGRSLCSVWPTGRSALCGRLGIEGVADPCPCLPSSPPPHPHRHPPPLSKVSPSTSKRNRPDTLEAPAPVRYFTPLSKVSSSLSKRNRLDTLDKGYGSMWLSLVRRWPPQPCFTTLFHDTFVPPRERIVTHLCILWRVFCGGCTPSPSLPTVAHRCPPFPVALHRCPRLPTVGHHSRVLRHFFTTLLFSAEDCVTHLWELHTVPTVAHRCPPSKVPSCVSKRNRVEMPGNGLRRAALSVVIPTKTWPTGRSLRRDVPDEPPGIGPRSTQPLVHAEVSTAAPHTDYMLTLHRHHVRRHASCIAFQPPRTRWLTRARVCSGRVLGRREWVTFGGGPAATVGRVSSERAAAAVAAWRLPRRTSTRRAKKSRYPMFSF